MFDFISLKQKNQKTKKAKSFKAGGGLVVPLSIVNKV
jgi:hypothetical protein